MSFERRPSLYANMLAALLSLLAEREGGVITVTLKDLERALDNPQILAFDKTDEHVTLTIEGPVPPTIPGPEGLVH